MFGSALGVGDFDNDGRNDLVVGAGECSVVGVGGDAGCAYVFYGTNLTSEYASTSDVRITGANNNDALGYYLTAADYNRDGKDDLVITAMGYNSSQGRVYIFYGGNIISESATGAEVTLTGEATNNSFGSSLTTEDFNADGRDDLAIGASRYTSSQGRTYLFYSTSTPGSRNASAADIILSGEASNSYFGVSLATGDLNADGKNDLVVGASRWNNDWTGRAYVFYGGGMTSKNATSADVIMTGEATNNSFGNSLTTGDLNSDGRDDLIVGAYGYNSSQGRVYIFYSQSGQVNLNQSITGEGTSDNFGEAMIGGDFNADGRTDLAVGAPADNSNTGKVYIFYNDGAYGTGASGADVILTGGNTLNYFGTTLVAGDYNRDGKDDIAVGASGYSSNTGRVYIFYGGSMVSEGVAGADVTYTGESSSDFVGSSLLTADFNVDGVDDLVMGGAFAGTASEGRVYIRYGGTMTSGNVSDADVILTGSSTLDFFSSELASADLNSDGIDDLVVGARDDSGTKPGSVYVFYGELLTDRNATSADSILVGESVGNLFGFSLVISDFNEDGKDDLAVSAPYYNSSQGRTYLFYGGPISSTSASNANVIITGETTNNYFGSSLTTGDFNHDGKDDLAFGAYRYNTYQGRAYIFYNDGSWPQYASTSDVTLTGETTNNYFGGALAAGDWNSDGRTDLAVGAYGYNSNQGRVYLYETRENYAWTIQRQSLKDGLRVHPLAGYEMSIIGESGAGGLGGALATGDLNGDGRDDLVIGAPSFNSNQGRVYVFYNDGEYGPKAGSADAVITGGGNGFASSVVVGDINNDGRNDLVTGAQDYSTYLGRVYIFLNNTLATSHLTSASADSKIVGSSTWSYFGHALDIADLDANGQNDLIVSAFTYDSEIGQVYIFSNGSGLTATSAKQADIAILGSGNWQSFGYTLTHGDFNADGRVDFAVTSTQDNSGQIGKVSVFYNDGTYATSALGADVTITGDNGGDKFGRDLKSGDLNADGKDDLVASSRQNNSQTGRVYIFYGGLLASGAANTANVKISGEGTANSFGTIFAGDWNGDSRSDLAVGASQYNSSQGRTYIFYNDGSYPTNATSADIILTGEAASNSYGSALATGDLNMDGRDDLIVGAPGYNSSQGRVYFYTFNDMLVDGAVQSSGFGYSLAAGDFNRDGKVDLAVGASAYNSNQGRVYVLYNNNPLTRYASSADVVITGEGGEFGKALLAADLDADGSMDLASGAPSYGSFRGRTYIFYNDGVFPSVASSADAIISGSSTSNWFGLNLGSGDLNTDGKVDLVVSSGVNYACIFYNDGAYPSNATSADVLILGENATDFGYDSETADWNSDGRTDLALSDYNYDGGIGRTYVFYNDGTMPTTAASADVTITGESVGWVFGARILGADLNSDGKDDLIVSADGYGNNNGKVYFFWNDGGYPTAAEDANWSITGDNASEYFGVSLVSGDFNHDSRMDVAVASLGYNTNQGRIYVFYNDGTYPERAQYADVTITGEAQGSTCWYSMPLISGDYNSDGTSDLAFGACGRNSGQGRVYVLISEAATQKYSSFKFQGDFKLQGDFKFQ